AAVFDVTQPLQIVAGNIAGRGNRSLGGTVGLVLHRSLPLHRVWQELTPRLLLTQSGISYLAIFDCRFAARDGSGREIAPVSPGGSGPPFRSECRARGRAEDHL